MVKNHHFTNFGERYKNITPTTLCMLKELQAMARRADEFSSRFGIIPDGNSEQSGWTLKSSPAGFGKHNVMKHSFVPLTVQRWEGAEGTSTLVEYDGRTVYDGIRSLYEPGDWEKLL